MKIKIFSLNTLGVPFSPNRKIRIGLIQNYIKKTSPDFVMFQECGDIFLLRNLKKNLDGLYNFHPNTFSGLINRHGALLFLSKRPIKSYEFRKYSSSAGPYLPFSFAEYLSQKGVQICKIEIDGKKITLLNTHLSASFFNNQKEYIHIKVQLDELINLIKEISLAEKIITGGDFNFPPENQLYRYFIDATNMVDPLFGKNLFTHTKENLNIKPIFRKLVWANKREDYIFLKGISDNHIFQQICDQKFNYNGKIYNLSDHYGILTTITL